MRGHSDERIADRVKWKLASFTRQPPDTVLFTNGDDCRAEGLRRVAEDRSAGLPIMAFWHSADSWTLLGSEKLVWSQRGHIQEVLLDALEWADSPGMWGAMRRELEADVDAMTTSRHKLEYEFLRVTDRRGSQFMVWTAPGGGCLILWNVLLMLIGMQKGGEDG